MSGTFYIVTGPTGVGKTELSLRWAESQKEKVEILSCDSLLVYKGMDIGTAKPARKDLERIPHHGIDLVSPKESFTVADYVRYARRVVEKIRREEKTLLITGGSGFYLKSFLQPVLDPVEIPESVSRAVRTLYQEQGYGAMVARVKALNPCGLGNLDLRNPRRVMRALERCLASGRQLPELQEEFRNQPLPFGEFKKKVCLLMRSRDSLRSRIEKRTREMLEAGLVKEVSQLLERGFRENPSAAGAIGYRETIAYLESGEEDIKGLEEAIVTETLKLVKKQQTWFRKQIPADQEINLDRVSSEEAIDRLFAG